MSIILAESKASSSYQISALILIKMRDARTSVTSFHPSVRPSVHPVSSAVPVCQMADSTHKLAACQLLVTWARLSILTCSRIVWHRSHRQLECLFFFLVAHLLAHTNKVSWNGNDVSEQRPDNLLAVVTKLPSYSSGGGWGGRFTQKGSLGFTLNDWQLCCVHKAAAVLDTLNYLSLSFLIKTQWSSHHFLLSIFLWPISKAHGPKCHL